MKIGPEAWGPNTEKVQKNNHNNNDYRGEGGTTAQTIKEFQKIENTILLNERAIQMLKTIAMKNNKSTYSELVIFLAKYYRDSTRNKDFEYGYGYQSPQQQQQYPE